jgi:hypothetical protein
MIALQIADPSSRQSSAFISDQKLNSGKENCRKQANFFAEFAYSRGKRHDIA